RLDVGSLSAGSIANNGRSDRSPARRKGACHENVVTGEARVMHGKPAALASAMLTLGGLISILIPTPALRALREEDLGFDPAAQSLRSFEDDGTGTTSITSVPPFEGGEIVSVAPIRAACSRIPGGVMVLPRFIGLGLGPP